MPHPDTEPILATKGTLAASDENAVNSYETAEALQGWLGIVDVLVNQTRLNANVHAAVLNTRTQVADTRDNSHVLKRVQSWPRDSTSISERFNSKILSIVEQYTQDCASLTGEISRLQSTSRVHNGLTDRHGPLHAAADSGASSRPIYAASAQTNLNNRSSSADVHVLETRCSQLENELAATRRELEVMTLANRELKRNERAARHKTDAFKNGFHNFKQAMFSEPAMRERSNAIDPDVSLQGHVKYFNEKTSHARRSAPGKENIAA